MNGKVALITGGGQGIGRALAEMFVAHGMSVMITGRHADKLCSAVDAIGALDRVDFVVGDAGGRDCALAAVEKTITRFGRIDVLVNNAQSTASGIPLEDLDEDAILRTLHSGLLGTLFHMQAAFPHMRRGGGGSIINMGSREGIFGGLGFGIYAATKEGIRGLSRVAAREWGRHNIRVNVICPAALSEAAAGYLTGHPAEAELYRQAIALGRFGDPTRDIGPIALFLASDESRYLTGQTLNADGGQMML
jgi:NAD(P)-dependent dehydrogenase (short-subunit alcohol dehydrogenase family)